MVGSLADAGDLSMSGLVYLWLLWPAFQGLWSVVFEGVLDPLLLSAHLCSLTESFFRASSFALLTWIAGFELLRCLLKLKEFILNELEAYEIKIGDQVFCRPGDPPLEAVIEKLLR